MSAEPDPQQRPTEGATRPVERRPVANPTLGWPWWVVAAGLGTALVLVATEHVLRATAALTASLLLAAGLRLVLPQGGCGGLRVRGKSLDVVVLLVLAVAVVVSGRSLDLTALR